MKFNKNSFLIGLIVLLCEIVFHISSLSAQSHTQLSPKETVQQFYSLLHKKNFIKAFQLSVYYPAIEKLTPTQMKELEPDFLAMSQVIPEDIELAGENITTDNATVYIKISQEKLKQTKDSSLSSESSIGVIAKENKTKQIESIPVNLIKVNNQWRIGDKETQILVKVHGNQFFFLDRSGIFQQMQINEAEIYDLVETLTKVEKGYANLNHGIYATLQELLIEKIVTDDVGSGKIFGYNVEIEVSQDRKIFTVFATPITHNITGRYSYYGDLEGTILRDIGGIKLTRQNLN